ncbi:PilZ domain-containing protein [Psychromonas sp. SP041]|uniref:PilZ domain-containing protein n=1 Tax=Psychromonas sp. SP041 TaxID=1365007 RepID=UPI0010C7D676|nr:PilZ domain-containing protein [Psychromonas sp. SP041]
MYFAQNEQRSFHRMEINLPIEIIKDGITYHGICSDLSSTGMRISFNKPGLSTGDEVNIHLNTDDERFLPLNATAKLIRVSEYGGENFSAAVEFLALK